jgi:hypothetical protein
MVNKYISLERVWNYALRLACPKLEIPSYDEELPIHSFHKFGCALGICDNCPQWNDFIPQMEQDCTYAIQYTVFGSYFKCVKQGHQNMLYNERSQAYCSLCSIDYGDIDDEGVPQPAIKKKVNPDDEV